MGSIRNIRDLKELIDALPENSEMSLIENEYSNGYGMLEKIRITIKKGSNKKGVIT